MLRIFRVSGGSMRPSLSSGDWIVTSRHRAPRIKDIVVASTDSGHHIVKRVASMTGDSMRLAGDNSRLASSYCESPIVGSSCIGTVIASFRPPLSVRFDFPEPL